MVLITGGTSCIGFQRLHYGEAEEMPMLWGKNPRRIVWLLKAAILDYVIGVSTRRTFQFFHGITSSIVIVCVDPAWTPKEDAVNCLVSLLQQPSDAFLML